MSWFILVVSGVFEAVWATALGRPDGLSRPWPTVVFFSALVVSMGGLAWSMRDLPTGTAYAVWVAVGAVCTVAWAMTTGEEPVTALRILFLTVIIGGVIGLKLVS
ncbi:DMT family transporter [Corynebacterium variabile]|uniref:DMT family transporter n=1 Tax=Corynebacterium variabile TaxID=1727 RepID=UPI003FD4142D